RLTGSIVQPPALEKSPRARPGSKLAGNVAAVEVESHLNQRRSLEPTSGSGRIAGRQSGAAIHPAAIDPTSGRSGLLCTASLFFPFGTLPLPKEVSVLHRLVESAADS